MSTVLTPAGLQYSSARTDVVDVLFADLHGTRSAGLRDDATIVIDPFAPTALPAASRSTNSGGPPTTR